MFPTNRESGRIVGSGRVATILEKSGVAVSLCVYLMKWRKHWNDRKEGRGGGHALYFMVVRMR